VAYDKEKAKSGMEGRTTQTERWGRRADVKLSTRKHRRTEGKKEVREQLDS
jgi:hypothetical protein